MLNPFRDLSQLVRSGRLALTRQVFQAAPSLGRAWEQRQFRRLAEPLDRLAVLVEGDVILRVSEFEGSFSLDCRSDLFRRLVLYGHYEPALTKLIKEALDYLGSLLSDGFDTVDIGANIGFHSVLFARREYGRCLALEPIPQAFVRLKGNLARNGVASRCIACEIAAAATTGETSMEVIEGMEEYAAFGAISHPAVSDHPRRRVKVATGCLDDLVIQHGLTPKLIKIDAEGAEASVLKGSLRTIAQHQPLVFMECGSGDTSTQDVSSRSLLTDLGYRFMDPISRTWLKDEHFRPDVLGVPEQFADEFARHLGRRLA